MKIFYWNDILTFLNTGNIDDFFTKGCGISIGSFDGLHKGHRFLLSTLKDECQKNNLQSGIVSFTRPLPSIKHSEDYTGDLSTLNQRLKFFEEMGFDFVILVDFDDSFASMLGCDFLNILVNVCSMELIAEGIDFRCGFKGATDTQAINYWGKQNNIRTVFVDPVYYLEITGNEERVSSSFIRQKIQNGFFTTVEELLERKYEIDLESFGGKTEIEKSGILQVLPPEGVYHCLDQNNEDSRIEITQNKILLENPCTLLKF
ncbi:MAG: FAD synthetase family protein [Treponema sp.]|nr:FAD synthetase family protein [Treponema sp.]